MKEIGVRFSVYAFEYTRKRKNKKQIPQISQIILCIFSDEKQSRKSHWITRFREWFCRLGFSRLVNVMKSFCASDWFRSHWIEHKAEKIWQIIIFTRLRCFELNGKSRVITTIYLFRVDQLSEFIGEWASHVVLWIFKWRAIFFVMKFLNFHRAAPASTTTLWL